MKSSDTCSEAPLADCTQPRGYSLPDAISEKMSDRRTRHDAFPHGGGGLAAPGRGRGDHNSAVAPSEKADVMGAVMGRAVIDWQQSGSTLLPGAICDNLTSFGGMLTERCHPDSAHRVPQIRCGGIQWHRRGTLRVAAQVSPSLAAGPLRPGRFAWPRPFTSRSRRRISC